MELRLAVQGHGPGDTSPAFREETRQVKLYRHRKKRIMQEYLVNIQITWPDDMTEKQLEQITVEEREMAKTRTKEGHLASRWRVPGRRENGGRLRAKNISELQEMMAELPVWPYMDVKVHS